MDMEQAPRRGTTPESKAAFSAWLDRAIEAAALLPHEDEDEAPEHAYRSQPDHLPVHGAVTRASGSRRRPHD